MFVLSSVSGSTSCSQQAARTTLTTDELIFLNQSEEIQPMLTSVNDLGCTDTTVFRSHTSALTSTSVYVSVLTDTKYRYRFRLAVAIFFLIFKNIFLSVVSKSTHAVVA